MTYGNGSVAENRVMQGAQTNNQCYLKNASLNGSQTGYLYNRVRQTIGDDVITTSATYANSSFTVFIRFNQKDGVTVADVNGSFNGTNLSPDSSASKGSGTTNYDPDTNEPIVNTEHTPGKTGSNFTESALQGTGSFDGGNYAPDYKKAPCGIEGHTLSDGKKHELLNCGHYDCLCSGQKIPDGGTYYIGVQGNQYLFKYEEMRTGGDCFPAECKNGDAYTYGDYEYRYNQYASYQANAASSPYWHYKEDFNGWGCDTRQNSKTSYSTPLSEINGMPLVSVGGAWSACTSITTAPEIPDTVWYLNYAYSKCTKLTTAPQLPPNTKSIDGIFQQCTALNTYVTSIDANGDFSNYQIPESTTSAYYMFLSCQAITHGPKIPRNVTTIWSAFTNCTSLVEPPDLTEAYSLTDMEYSFRNCPALKKPPVIPSTVTVMREAFCGCTSMETAPVLPEGVENLYRVFKNCTSLKTAPVIPENATYLCELFYGCTSLTGTITINSGPKRAHDNSHASVFYGVDFKAQQITLEGASNDLDTIGRTGQNYCTTCNGMCKNNH